MAKNPALTKEYADLIRPLLDDAKRAYGARTTDSPQHAASREYTRLLCEYYNEKKGSLLDLAEVLEVQYAGLRRRVTTADIPASTHRPRKKFSEEEYMTAVDEITNARLLGTEAYHDELKHYYDLGMSLAKIASQLGLSSANPLYYGVSRARMRQEAGS